MDLYIGNDLKDVENAVSEFCEKEFDQEYLQRLEDEHKYPIGLYEKIGELGFIGVGFSEDIGGSGYGALGHVVAVTEMCRRLPGMGMALSLGYIPGFVVDIYGNSEQREKYVRPMIEGKYISAISVTEPDSGSDIGSLQTRMEDKKDHFIVNGSKVFTTNAGYADFYTLLAKDESGLTTVLFDKDLIGKNGPKRFEINDLGRKMGINTTTSGELVFTDFAIPKDYVIGQRGKGMKTVLNGFELGRIVIAAQAFGSMLYGYEKAVDYAKKRKQFGRPIIKFQSIEHELVDMYVEIEQCRNLLYKAAWLYDRKDPESKKFSSMVKLAIPECAIRILNQSVDILGGYGYMRDQGLEGALRDIRITSIYEGTSKIQKIAVAKLLY
ncbi:MAG TPA: acyl-CoA dehydrogenase family protein [Syntrophorhabdaceae bacterium]|nr:acyl-CoA dehydrogenase family protein [Syntrophorhabdaceae bacterium]